MGTPRAAFLLVMLVPTTKEKNMSVKYAVHSTVRGRHNRTLRAQSPVHHTLTQHLAGGDYRLVRGRPVQLTEEKFQLLLPELREKAAAGILEVKTLDGRLVDLTTLETSTLPAPVPAPHPPLDSIANDKPAGNPMPQFPGGDTAISTFGPPSLVTGAPSEAPEPQDMPEAAADEEAELTEEEAAHTKSKKKGRK